MTDRTGVVLATGADGFGDRYPPLVALGDDPLVCHVVDALTAVTSAVVVACPSAHRAAIGAALGDRAVRIATDPGPDASGLAGFGTALDVVDTPAVALVGATMPAVDPRFLQFLFERVGGNEAAVPRLPDGERQPRQAVYRTGPAQAAAAASLAHGEGFAALVDRLQAVELSPTEVQQQTSWRSLRPVTAERELAGHTW